MEIVILNNIFNIFKKTKQTAQTTNNKEKLSNKERLENILAFSTTFMKYEGGYEEFKPAFDLIKILSAKIFYDYSISILDKSNAQFSDQYLIFKIDDLFFDEKDTPKDLLLRINRDFLDWNIEKTFNVSLSEDPVLSFPKEHHKLKNHLKEIGTESNQWKQYELNHYTTTIFPVGLCYFYNGRNSSFVGIVKRKGEMLISPNNGHYFRNFSKLYEYMKFDGENYILKENGKIIGKALSFEFGCIFEI